MNPPVTVSALLNLYGQVMQAREGFGIYHDSPTMAEALSEAETALRSAGALDSGAPSPSVSSAAMGGGALFAPLDTYPADLLNDNPPRREDVTEIQDREAGELLCYAHPDQTERICQAVNAFPDMARALLGALHHDDGCKPAYRMPESLRREMVAALIRAGVVSEGKEGGK